MSQDHPVEKQAIEEPNEYYKLEISQVIERVNSLDNLRLQAGTLLGTANLTVLGVGLSVQKAGVLFISSAIVITFLLMDIYIRRAVISYFYRGLHLQKRFAPHDEETFLHIIPGALASQARKISELKNPQERKSALNKIRIPVQSPFFWILLIIAIAEAGLGFALWLVFNWNLY